MNDDLRITVSKSGIIVVELNTCSNEVELSKALITIFEANEKEEITISIEGRFNFNVRSRNDLRIMCDSGKKPHSSKKNVFFAYCISKLLGVYQTLKKD